MQHHTAQRTDAQTVDRFGALPLSILVHPEIEPTAKVLLAILSAHMGAKGAWPGIATLAAGVGRDASTVRRQLCELADLGLITWSHEMRGGRRLCVYRFTFDRFGGLGVVKLARTAEDQPEPLAEAEDQPEPLAEAEDQPEPLAEAEYQPETLAEGIAHRCTVHKEQRTNPPNPPPGRGAVRAGKRIPPGSIRLGRAERAALDGQQGAVGERCPNCGEQIQLADVGLVWSTWGDAIPAVIRIRWFDEGGSLKRQKWVHQRCLDLEARSHSDVRGRSWC